MACNNTVERREIATEYRSALGIGMICDFETAPECAARNKDYGEVSVAAVNDSKL